MSLDGAEAFKHEVITDYEEKLSTDNEINLYRLLCLQHDFSNEWYRFISEENSDFVAELKEEHFPYFATTSGRNIVDKTLFKITEDGKLDPEKGKILNSTNMKIKIDKDDLDEVLASFAIVGFKIDMD